MSDDNPLQTLNVMNQILGLEDNPCIMRARKINRNPDRFHLTHFEDYKEDYELIEGSVCHCGCKTAIFIKEEWTGEYYDAEHITQIEYEKLPSQPKPTKAQQDLECEIIACNIKEEKLGIIHGQQSCNMIPVPKLVFDVDKIK